MQKGFSPIAIIVIILILLAAGGGVYYWQKLQPRVYEPLAPSGVEGPANNESNQVACPADAKQCPDGSYVSRVPPNCDFAPCPGSSQQTSVPADWKSYRNDQYGLAFRYPKSWVNCSDSDQNARLRGSLRLICIESNITTYFGDKDALAVNIENELKKQYPDYSSLKLYLGPSPIELVIDGKKVFGSKMCDADCWGTYFVFTDEDLIAIKVSYGDPMEINQILSTFRFIE